MAIPLHNLYVKDVAGSQHPVRGVYRMSLSGSWSADFRQVWGQTYRTSPTHPDVDWRKVFDDGSATRPAPTIPPSSLMLTADHGLITRASWGSAGYSTHLYYQVVTAAGVEVDGGTYNRSMNVTDSDMTEDVQEWDNAFRLSGWRIRLLAQLYSDGGGGPFAGPTPSVALII